MVKSIISMIVVSLIILSACFFERIYVNNQFSEFSNMAEEVYYKVDEKTATEEDIKALQTSWLKKKKTLHIFVPHNDIKEIDLWVTEAITLVRDEKWEDALSKIEVIKELAEELPQYFILAIDNIL